MMQKKSTPLSVGNAVFKQADNVDAVTGINQHSDGRWECTIHFFGRSEYVRNASTEEMDALLAAVNGEM